MREKPSFFFIPALLFLITFKLLYSQVEIKFNEFPKETLNGWDLWKFTAKNTGKDNLTLCYSLSVTYNDTLLYEASTKEYTLLAGETMEVTEGWEKQNIQNWLSNIYKRMIIREGDFLPGEYKICMAAFTANTKHQPDKDKPIGSQCVNHTVVNYESGAVMEIKPKVPEKGRLTLEDLWNFTITNKSKYKQITEVYWMLKFNGQDMYEGYTKAFSVKPGETTDQSFKSRDIVVNHWFIEKMRDSILKTQVFPPGNYNLCLTVRSEWSKTEFGTGCIDAIVEEKK